MIGKEKCCHSESSLHLQVQYWMSLSYPFWVHCVKLTGSWTNVSNGLRTLSTVFFSNSSQMIWPLGQICQINFWVILGSTFNKYFGTVPSRSLILHLTSPAFFLQKPKLIRHFKGICIWIWGLNNLVPGRWSC